MVQVVAHEKGKSREWRAGGEATQAEGGNCSQI